MDPGKKTLIPRAMLSSLTASPFFAVCSPPATRKTGGLLVGSDVGEHRNCQWTD